MHDVSMPVDWNDQLGWENFYQARIANRHGRSYDESIGSIGIDQLPHLAAELRTEGWLSVWLPGCGMSPLACLLTQLGMDVTATDISPTAIAFQHESNEAFPELLRNLGAKEEGGTLKALVHDFRTPFEKEAFDLILNVKAIQGFPASDMVAISRVHLDALRPGRQVYFDTMNVQGDRRDVLEQAISDGGFVVPFMDLNHWYRKTLHETGLPHISVLGQPMIPRTGEYANGGAKWEAGMAQLREITSEYRSRLAASEAAEQVRCAGDAKVARLIYSTG